MANPKGRKLKKIDWEYVSELLMKGSNGIQVAAVLGIHPDVLYDRCRIENGEMFSDYSQKCWQKGNSSLHAKQYEVAKEGNTTMLVWLGKQRLDQKEQKEKELPDNLEQIYQQTLEEIKELRAQLKEERRANRSRS